MHQTLQFGDDQTNLNPSCNGPCYQWVHGEETQSTTETITGPHTSVSRSDQSDWTIDAPNAFLTSGADFFLPAAVSQQLSNVATQQDGRSVVRRTSLAETVIGYGALEENSGVSTITNGDTTGTVSYQTSGAESSVGRDYERTVVARGGQIVMNVVQARSAPAPG